MRGQGVAADRGQYVGPVDLIRRLRPGAGAQPTRGQPLSLDDRALELALGQVAQGPVGPQGGVDVRQADTDLFRSLGDDDVQPVLNVHGVALQGVVHGIEAGPPLVVHVLGEAHEHDRPFGDVPGRKPGFPDGGPLACDPAGRITLRVGSRIPDHLAGFAALGAHAGPEGEGQQRRGEQHDPELVHLLLLVSTL